MKPSAPRQADRQTGGINVNLIVHCSVVVSPLHPAKWLLINQPDLLLSYSVDRLLASASSGGGRYRSCTNDHQELLKHNSPPASVSPVSLCLSASLSVLMNFIEWSSGVQAESICALLDCKKSLSFILLMSESSSVAICDTGVLSLPPVAAPCLSVGGAGKWFNFATRT